MGRRRLAAFAGALGLVAWLVSSGVSAQADTPMTDSAFNSMVGYYTLLANSGQTKCSGPGLSHPGGAGTCTFTQGTALIPSTQDNVAVCVEYNTPVEDCTIDQFNATHNNVAIVIQIMNQKTGATQDATQTGTIRQHNLSGNNFAAVLQFVNQFTNVESTQLQTDSQSATIEQNDAASLLPPPPLATGRNLAILGESSKQVANTETAVTQTQESDQDVHDAGHHINQYSQGLSKAFAGQSQVQKIDGDGTRNQTVDPKCCSIQQSNTDDTFNIGQFVSITADHPGATQNALSLGECHSSGTCTTFQSSSVNGVTTTNSCPAPSQSQTGTCIATIVCTGAVCAPCSTTSEGCSPPECFPSGCLTLLNNGAFGNLALASGRGSAFLALRAPAASSPSARSGSSLSLLT